MATDNATSAAAVPDASVSAEGVDAAAAAPPAAAGAGDGDASAATHIPLGRRLSLVSWGDGSVPSMPDIDDDASAGSVEKETISLKSTTSSLRSSVHKAVEENGRTYHSFKMGKYMLPNDAQEQERLDMQHAIFLLTTNGKSFLAPIKDPKNVLDIATGTGIWPIEFAIEFPDAKVTGTDLSPIQPEFVPPNCHFEIDDVEDEWTFTKPFDYIHGRALITCFTDPSVVIRSAFAHCAPGGYFELQDGSFPMHFASPPPANCALKRWNELILESAALAGRPWTNTVHYKRWMIEAGFEDVVERRFHWPINTWARGNYYKTIGAYVQADMLSGIEGYSLKLLGRLGWSAEKSRELIEEVRRDFMDTKVHAYITVLFVWGKKPEAKAATGTTEATDTTPADPSA